MVPKVEREQRQTLRNSETCATTVPRLFVYNCVHVKPYVTKRRLNFNLPVFTPVCKVDTVHVVALKSFAFLQKRLGRRCHTKLTNFSIMSYEQCLFVDTTKANVFLCVLCHQTCPSHDALRTMCKQRKHDHGGHGSIYCGRYDKLLEWRNAQQVLVFSQNRFHCKLNSI